MTQINPERLVTFKELKEFFGVPYTRVHLLRLEKAGTFPKRIALSHRRVVWRAEAIIEWSRNLQK